MSLDLGIMLAKIKDLRRMRRFRLADYHAVA